MMCMQKGWGSSSSVCVVPSCTQRCKTLPACSPVSPLQTSPQPPRTCGSSPAAARGAARGREQGGRGRTAHRSRGPLPCPRRGTRAGKTRARGLSVHMPQLCCRAEPSRAEQSEGAGRCTHIGLDAGRHQRQDREAWLGLLGPTPCRRGAIHSPREGGAGPAPRLPPGGRSQPRQRARSSGGAAGAHGAALLQLAGGGDGRHCGCCLARARDKRGGPGVTLTSVRAALGLGCGVAEG